MPETFLVVLLFFIYPSRILTIVRLLYISCSILTIAKERPGILRSVKTFRLTGILHV